MAAANKACRRGGLAALAVAATAGLVLSVGGKALPKKWSLGLTLQVSGRYQVISRGITYNGDFAFTLTWEGAMEEDDDDFRLVRREVSLPHWEAHETASAISEDSTLAAADFLDKPSFRTFYVLQEGRDIQIVFSLEEFDIPVNFPGEKVLLDLPRTAGGDMSVSDVDYQGHIKKGSNVLRVPSQLLVGRQAERTSTWSWRRQRSLPASDQILSVFSNHQVAVKVVIRPQADSP